MYASKRFITALVIFASVPVFQPSFFVQSESTCSPGSDEAGCENITSCISNYADLKRALFENGMGNIERLLYTFTPTNSPIPHFVWVFYFHNESMEWEGVLTCPSRYNLDRCPAQASVTDVNDSYQLLFWADSPLLINMDIPLLKFLSYNFILQYLGNGACVQLVIPPFCESVESQLEVEMLKFATSYLQAYSISTTESDRDYVLYCEEKFEVESDYDGYLLASEVIIGLGSLVIFAFLGFKLCSGKGETAGEMLTRFCPCFEQVRCCNVEEAVDSDGEDDQTQPASTSGNQQPISNKHNSIQTRKTYISMFMIIIIVTVFFLAVDTVNSPVDILNFAFSYHYGIINFVLMFLASVLIVFIIILYGVRLFIYVLDHIHNRRPTSRVSNKCKQVITLIGTILTFASFLYILSRMFMISLAFATYPYDVGFTLLAIGSIVVAFLFVAWAAFHITADSRKKRRKCGDIFISLSPYIALLFILLGFLVSYIAVILRVSIHPADPVTSLASTLFPGIIAFVASTQYDKQRKLLSGDAPEQPKQKKPTRRNVSSSNKRTEELELRDTSSPSAEPKRPEVVTEDTV